MPLAQKSKTFCQNFIAFMKSALSFEHFLQNEESDSLSISELIISRTRNYLNLKKILFQNTLLGVNVLMGPKDCGNKQQITCLLFHFLEIN